MHGFDELILAMERADQEGEVDRTVLIHGSRLRPLVHLHVRMSRQPAHRSQSYVSNQSVRRARQ
jgi:hypothetical protein